MAESQFTNRMELGLGEASLFLVVWNYTISILDSYSRWETIVSLHYYLRFLDSPLAVPVLLVIGLFLIHHSQTAQLARSIQQSQGPGLRDATGERIVTPIKIPSLRVTLLVILAAILMGGLYVLAWITTYSPVVATLSPRVVVAIEKTKPWSPPIRSKHQAVPTIEQKSYGPNSPNVNASHDLQFNYNAEPPSRLLTEPQQKLLIDDLSNIPPAPFWIIVESGNQGFYPVAGRQHLETMDEQGLFAQQLREILTKAKWTDLLCDQCGKITPCVSPHLPAYTDVSDKGVSIMGNMWWPSAEGLGKLLAGRFGMRVMLKPNVISYYPNPQNNPLFNLQVVLIVVGIQ